MAPIEPGTYRIVNVLSKKAISVQNHDHCAIIGKPAQNDSSQQWFVQRSGEGYRFKNCLYGNYITIGSTEWSAMAYLGQYPPTWQILPHGDGIYVIQYGDFDRVLDMHREHEPSNGEIHIWPKHDLQPQKHWKFERLSDDTGHRVGGVQGGIEGRNEEIAAKNQELAEKDKFIGQLGEQLAQKNRQLVEQTAQLVTQSQQIVTQGQQIATQSQQLVEQSRELAQKSDQMAQKDEETMRSYKELGDKLAWVAQRENALRRERDDSRPNEINTRTVGSLMQESSTQQQQEHYEVAALKEKLEKLERLVAQMMDGDANKHHNMP